MLEGDPDEHPVYCTVCEDECNLIEDPFMFGKGDHPYCSENCYLDDLFGTVE